MNLSKVTVILRGYSYEQVRNVAKAMSGTSFNSIEITTNSPDAFNTVKKISEEFPNLNIGVGTVKNIKEIDLSYFSNAKFILSPIKLGKKEINFAKSRDLITVISAFSPSEIMENIYNGADIVKIFPADSLEYNYAKSIKAPLGNIRLMAVGGVNKNNARKFLENGYDYLGIGSGMFDKKDIISGNINNLKSSIKEFEVLLGEIND